jgi:hypothetical protein
MFKKIINCLNGTDNNIAPKIEKSMLFFFSAIEIRIGPHTLLHVLPSSGLMYLKKISINSIITANTKITLFIR